MPSICRQESWNSTVTRAMAFVALPMGEMSDFRPTLDVVIVQMHRRRVLMDFTASHAPRDSSPPAPLSMLTAVDHVA